MVRKTVYMTVLSLLFVVCMFLTTGITVLADTTDGTTDEDGLITITFDYGAKEEYLKKNNYTIDGTTYSTSVKVASGSTLYDIMNSDNPPVLPSQGTEINRANFEYWQYVDEDGYNSYVYPNSSYDDFDKDVTLTASWYNTVTYHACSKDDTVTGHFYDGSIMKSQTYSGSDTILNVSYCCYSDANDKAFVGWSLDGTEEGLVYDSWVVEANFDLYPVYVDGYAVTFNVNLEGGSLYSYYESYKDSDGGYNYNSSSRDLDSGTLTLTYPNGFKPSDAPYFCCDPFRYPETQLSQGDKEVEFSNWSSDSSGTTAAYFGNLTSSTATLYAVWKEYWVVTYDANTGEEYTYKETEHVIKGNGTSGVTYSSFDYRDYYDKENDNYEDFIQKECISFNTKPDGTGTKISAGYVPTSNITVYAQYKDVYTVSLDGNGGTIEDYYTRFYVDQGEELKIGTNWTVVWPPATGETLSRKVFSSWNTMKDGSGVTVGTDDAEPFIPTSNVTLYAIPEDGVLVTFDSGAQGDDFGTIFNFRGSGNVTKATYAYPKNKTLNSTPYMDYYVNDKTKQFAGWSTAYGDLSKIVDLSTFKPTQDITLYAVWYDMVPVTYHANGGNYIYSDDQDSYTTYVVKGKKFNPYNTEEPVISDGFVLSGWSERAGGSNVIPYGTSYVATGSMDFYAVWEKGYIITFDGNGGSVEYHSHGHSGYGDNTKALVTIKKGSAVFDSSDESYEKVWGYHDDFILVGWSKTKNGEPVDLTTYVPENDETFYALWETPCVVTFDPDVGTLEYGTNQNVQKGTGVSYLPEPKAENLFFAGWYTDIGTSAEAAFDLNTIVNSNITVTAKWVEEKDTVTLSFDAGAGATFYYNSSYVQKCSVKVAKDSRFDLDTYSPSVSGQSFAETRFGGWESTTYKWNVGDDSKRYYTVTADDSFTAIWEKLTYYDVTFDGNGGKVEITGQDDDPSESVMFKILQGDRIDDVVFAQKESSEFTGWYLDKECTKLVATPDKIASYKPTATITLYAGYKQEKANVAVSGISLSKETITIGISDDKVDSVQLEAIIYPTDATNSKVTYSSSANDVATVSDTGLVTAKKVGSAIITVTTEDGGFSASCTVNVTAVTVDDVNTKIKELKEEITGAASPEEAKAALKESIESMGGLDRITELASTDEAVAEKLAEVENAYIEKAGITVEDPAKDAANISVLQETFGVAKAEAENNLSVAGAGLNAQAGDTIGLSVNAVAEKDEKKIDEKYENAKQVDINLTTTSADGEEKTVEELDAPVTITMPIPSGMIRSKLYILHFNEDGTYELIRPVFKNNSMSFTISHFSIFAFVELAEGISEGGNENGENDTCKHSNTEIKDAKAATATTKGYTGDTYCKDCGIKLETGKEIPATGGNNSGSGNNGNTDTNTGNTSTGSDTGSGSTTGTTTVAVKDGETVTETGSTVKYEVSSAKDKTVAYAGDTSAAGKVTVKSTIKVGNDTYTVTAIADGAFKKSKITSVTIPDTVVSIGKSAFEGSTKLKSVTFKGTKLTTIGDSAFKGCTVLTKVTLAKGVKTVGKQAFANCKKLKTITVKSKKTKFLKNSLKSVPKSAKLKLPKMTAKEKKAFKKMLKSAGFKGKIK